MRIDPTDLKLLRAIEWGGIIACNSAVKELKLDETDVRERLERLRREGLVKGLKATIFVPPFLGRDWVWGCTLIQARRPAAVADAIRRKIPFVTEVLYNTSLPAGIGYNLSVLFYATDFPEVEKFLSEIRDIDYVEVYEIGRYSFPLAQSFSADEMHLLRSVAEHPDADLALLAKLTRKPLNWVQTKLEALVWDPDNTKGVILVVPEIDWRRAENFAHIHFLLETSVAPDSVVTELKKQGFTSVFEGRRYRKKYLQLEADVWGFEDLRAKKAALDATQGVSLSGILMSEDNTVVTEWVSGLLGNAG
jgi:DNA-binding Lrp family transcriptional regulator